MKRAQLNIRTAEDDFDRLEALAHRLGLSLAEVVRRFLSAGIEANPVTDDELRNLRARRKHGAAKLVVPVAPVGAKAQKRRERESSGLRLPSLTLARESANAESPEISENMERAA